eukprot:4536506-Pleurochrysis_carterae.AAC.1
MPIRHVEYKTLPKYLAGGDLREQLVQEDLQGGAGATQHYGRVGQENVDRSLTYFCPEAEIKQARFTGDAQDILNKKQARLDHHKLARADKLAY